MSKPNPGTTGLQLHWEPRNDPAIPASEGLTMKWVKLPKYCELSGDTPDAVYAKNRRHIWTDGIQYRKAEDGCLWINTEEVEKWVEQSRENSSQRAA